MAFRCVCPQCLDSNVAQLEFKRQIVQTSLIRYRSVLKGSGRPHDASRFSCTNSRISDDIRYDYIDHLIEQTQDRARRRCQGEQCSKECNKCDVGHSIYAKISYTAYCNLLNHTQMLYTTGTL